VAFYNSGEEHFSDQNIFTSITGFVCLSTLFDVIDGGEKSFQALPAKNKN